MAKRTATNPAVPAVPVAVETTEAAPVPQATPEVATPSPAPEVAVSTPAAKTAKVTGPITVKYRDHIGMETERTFSQEVHGPDFAKLAEEFRATNASKLIE